MLSDILRGRTQTVVLRAGLMIAAVAIADRGLERVVPFAVNIPLGFLYLFPMLLVGNACNRWAIATAAAVCTFLTEAFDTFEWVAASGIPRDILYFAAFFCMGLFVYEVNRNRQLAQEHVHRIEEESKARRDAEEQLAVLVESSPAAIVTMDANGSVLLANDAAHRLFGLTKDQLPGRSIRDYLPALLHVPAHSASRQALRTAMQCRGRRDNDEMFLADIWFSTYRTSAGSRLAAVVVDTSEDLRNREESGLHQLLAGSRILVGAVSHEIRNVCGAIALVYANLSRDGRLAGDKDFEALDTLIQALEKIASFDLRQQVDQAGDVDLYSLLEELRIVIEPAMHEQNIRILFSVETGLPTVWADRQSLMQVFLNVTKNSERAMADSGGELRVEAQRERDVVSVRFRDTGGGVRHPERLFRPFQQGAQSTGLGLYLSRGFMRSFRGDLRYEPEPRGSSFIVELSPVDAKRETTHHESSDPASAHRRSQPFSREPEPAASGRN